MKDKRKPRSNRVASDDLLGVAADWVAEYWPGATCRSDRCRNFRRQDSEGQRWCWILSGIGSEGQEADCPAYRHAAKLTPNAELRGAAPEQK